MAKRMDRRRFLKVLGVTGGGAAATGCSTGTPEKLIPYLVRPKSEDLGGLAGKVRARLPADGGEKLSGATPFVIAISGPSGAGKTTVTKAVASDLGHRLDVL